MSIMTGFRATALVLGASAFVSGSAIAAMVDGPAVKWNHSVWGKKRAFTASAEKLAEILKEKTGGKFIYKIHYGAALSKSKENLDGIKLGAFQAATFCNFYSPGKNPAYMIFSLPFLPMNDWKTSLAVRKALLKHPALVADMDRWNAMAYTTTLLPTYQLMGKGAPPMKITDWDGKRVRAGGGIGTAMELLGSTRTTMPAPEVYTAIQRGTIDAVSFPFTYAFAAYKIDEVSQWFTGNLSPGTAECPIIFNKDAYAKLPAQYQKLLQDSIDEVDQASIAAYKKHDLKNLPNFKANLKEIVYPADELAKFHAKAGKPVWDEWVAKNKGKFDAASVLKTVFDVAASVK